MSRPPNQERRDGEPELIYEEYDLGQGFLATVFDPEDDESWIQSDTTMPIRE